MNLNVKEIFDEALKELIPDLKTKARTYFTRFFDSKLRVYFADRHEIQRIKDYPRSYGSSVDPNDPDLGLANKVADDFITESVLDENLKAYMKWYMEGNWKKELNAAMDKAMRHKANAIAFKAVKRLGKTENLRIQVLVSDYLTKEGYNTNFFSSMTCSEYIELKYKFKITSEQVEVLAKMLPEKSIFNTDEGTSIRVYHEEIGNA